MLFIGIKVLHTADYRKDNHVDKHKDDGDNRRNKHAFFVFGFFTLGEPSFLLFAHGVENENAVFHDNAKGKDGYPQVNDEAVLNPHKFQRRPEYRNRRVVVERGKEHAADNRRNRRRVVIFRLFFSAVEVQKRQN